MKGRDVNKRMLQLLLFLALGACANTVTVETVQGCPLYEIDDLDPVDEIYCGCDEYVILALQQDSILILDVDAVAHEEGTRLRVTKLDQQFALALVNEQLEDLFNFGAHQTGSVDFVFYEGAWLVE